METSKVIELAFSVEIEYVNFELSHYTQIEIYSEDGYPYWEPIIYICTAEVQCMANYLELPFKVVHDAVLAHERGHAMSALMGNDLEDLDEELIAWEYAEQYFFEGSKAAFESIKALALSSYEDPAEKAAGYIAAMFEYFKARNLEDILF